MSVDDAIWNALTVNMGFKQGEKVFIICQQWAPHLGDHTNQKFADSALVCQKMLDVFQKKGVDAVILSYIPTAARNGVDADKALYNHAHCDIVFMPTPYSLTHTAFRSHLTAGGARIASMPGFTLKLFEPGGPMDIDYNEASLETQGVAYNLKTCKKVRITGDETDITVEIDPKLVHQSDGIMRNKGDYGNLPGAEAYAVPIQDGNTNGKFSVPSGWGGSFPLKYEVTFIIKQGRFVDAIGTSMHAQYYINKYVKPIFDQKNFDVLAELGIGTNPGITPDFINQSGWSTLVAEKVAGSAHFANGNSKAMGGQNDVPIHIDWIVPNVKIDFLQ